MFCLPKKDVQGVRALPIAAEYYDRRAVNAAIGPVFAKSHRNRTVRRKPRNSVGAVLRPVVTGPNIW
jgi:hypothetical protein